MLALETLNMCSLLSVYVHCAVKLRGDVSQL